MRLGKRLKNLLSDKKGNVLILTAFAMPLIVGSAGLAIDTIQLSLLRRHLQRAVDSGALAGAYTRAQTEGTAAEPAVRAAVTQALQQYDAFPAVAATTLPETGLFGGRAVQVHLTATRTLPFWSFFRSTPPSISVEATAALVFQGQYCMVALDEGTGTGITFGGNATVNLGCGIISNTSGANAVDVNGGSATVTASPVAAVGGVPSSPVYQGKTLLLPYSLKQEDPFKDVPNPSPPAACQPKMTDATAVTSSGGCYSGLDIDGAKTLPPGQYYITGDFKLNSNANITANGVTFIFTSDPAAATPYYPKIDIDGSAKLNLTAPTSGTYKGIIMHYDGRAPTPTSKTNSHTINGNSNSTFEGAFYFPSQNLTFNGNAGVTTNCIQLVAKHLTFEGHTKINNSCTEGGGAQAFNATWVRLVA